MRVPCAQGLANYSGRGHACTFAIIWESVQSSGIRPPSASRALPRDGSGCQRLPPVGICQRSTGSGAGLARRGKLSASNGAVISSSPRFSLALESGASCCCPSCLHRPGGTERRRFRTRAAMQNPKPHLARAPPQAGSSLAQLPHVPDGGLAPGARHGGQGGRSARCQPQPARAGGVARRPYARATPPELCAATAGSDPMR